jgi:hypothetical protein
MANNPDLTAVNSTRAALNTLETELANSSATIANSPDGATRGQAQYRRDALPGLINTARIAVYQAEYVAWNASLASAGTQADKDQALSMIGHWKRKANDMQPDSITA